MLGKQEEGRIIRMNGGGLSEILTLTRCYSSGLPQPLKLKGCQGHKEKSCFSFLLF